MSDLMQDAFLMGRKTEGPKAREYLNEAVATAERFSRMTEDLEEKCRCANLFTSGERYPEVIIIGSSPLSSRAQSRDLSP